MSPLRNYAVVTASYWGFTLTDGALRMLVLLHFYSLGYTPFMLAFLFLLYETAGIFANLGGGWLATRFGIPRMLMTGLALQIAGLAAAVGARSGLECGGFGRLGGRRARHRRAWPRTSPRPPRNPRSRRRRKAARPAVQMGRLVHRLEERHEGHRLLRRRPAAGNRWLPPALWLMAGVLAVMLLPAWPEPAAHARQGQGLEILPRAVRQIARHQPDGGRAHLPVRLARCLVRRRPAGVPLQPGLALSWRSPASSRRWTIGYGLVQAIAPSVISPQRGRPQPRGAGSAAVGRGADRHSRSCSRSCCSDHRWRGPIWSWSVGLAFSASPFAVNLVAAFLSDPGLCRIGEGRRGCRLLLRGECRRAADRHPAVRCALPGGRHGGLSVGVGGHARRLPGDHLPAATGCRRSPPSRIGPLIAKNVSLRTLPDPLGRALHRRRHRARPWSSRRLPGDRRGRDRARSTCRSPS